MTRFCLCESTKAEDTPYLCIHFISFEMDKHIYSTFLPMPVFCPLCRARRSTLDTPCWSCQYDRSPPSLSNASAIPSASLFGQLQIILWINLTFEPQRTPYVTYGCVILTTGKSASQFQRNDWYGSLCEYNRLLKKALRE